MRLSDKDRLGAYEIRHTLGKGGMGEVYLATDPRLDRDVAIKVLPERMAGNPESLRRFEREAKALAAISHPNILTVYDVGKQEDIAFVVMELLKGQTLREELMQSSFSWKKTLEIAKQIAEGLSAAHARGIIHRDLKPENIFLTADGHVKILDFGLAQLKPTPSRDEVSEAVTNSFQTQAGTVLGTVPYMSPEQLKGESVDSRTDIFSFGCVLYEMVSGKRPFLGNSSAEISASILKDDPRALFESIHEIPLELDHLILRCLKKNPDSRFQTASDLAYALKELGGSQIVTKSIPRSSPPRLYGYALMFLALLFISVVTYLVMKPSDDIHSLAVLPFVNESKDPDAEYLSDGITESLINHLSRLPELKVIARTTVFTYKGKSIDPQQIGSKLKVQTVLTGRVLQRGDQINIQADLLNVNDGSQLWGEQYDRNVADILAVQRDIAKEIAEKLRTRLSDEETKKATESPTQNSQAYQLYLKGRYLWNKRTIEDIKKSIPYFDQAIDVDPNYALAYSGLSDSYNAFWSYGVSSAHEALPKAKAAASRALALDDNLAEAHASLALYLMDYEYDRAGAVREFKRAIELNPNYAYAHQGYAQLLHSTGRFEESLAEARRTADLDPLSRISNNVVARVLFYARRYDEAIVQFRRNINFDPNWMLDRYYLYQAYAAKGMYAEAVAEFNVFQALYGEPASEIQATRESFAKSGWNGFLQHRVEHLEAKSKREYVRAYDIAILYSPIGHTDKAIAWLEKAYEEREYGMSDLNAPWFDKIRSDPRFEDLLRRVRLQQ